MEKENEISQPSCSLSFDGENKVGTKRHLKARHIEMIAIGGTIGTGLFIKSGGLIVSSGALGALISYILAGLTVFTVVMSLGEMASMYPVSGSFNIYAERFVDPALGFTSAWTYWLSWVLGLPVEIQAAASFLGYWFPEWNQTVVMVALLFIILLLNLVTVKAYGETEFWLSILKVLAIIVFIFVGCSVIFRNGYQDFRMWSDPDPLGGNGITSFFSGLVGACFAFGGTELVGITAGEAENPRHSVPKAIKGTFWRIMMFYISSILIIGLILSANALSLKQDESELLQSPFVLVFQIANIPASADIMNFIGFIAVFSAANSSVYASSRTLMALCESGHGTRLFSKTSKRGVPVAGVIVSLLFGSVSLLTKLVGTNQLFDFLVQTVGLNIVMTWIFICYTHIRFRKAYIYQGYKLDDLPYRSITGIYGNYVGIFILVGIIILSGMPYDDSKFLLQNYIGLVIYPILYYGFKFSRGTLNTCIPIQDVDLMTDMYFEKQRDSVLDKIEMHEK